MKLRRTWILVAGLLLIAAFPVWARKWTSTTGRFSVEAELVVVKDGSVKLKKQDGKTITVPVAKLSKADRDYLASIAEAKLAAAKLARDEALAIIKKVKGSTVMMYRGRVSLVSITNRSFTGDINSSPVTDATLVHLKALTHISALYLKLTRVTDAGLVHLKGMKLGILSLQKTRITDAGLEHLKGLTKLRLLDLKGTKVTDAGLEHLIGLTKLRTLDLKDTKVTDEGVKKLQKALPNCSIRH